MSSLIRLRCLVVVMVALVACPLAHAAEKVKGFYSGSGGLTPDVHRVVLVEFAANGTAIVQQNWDGKDPQVWHGRWVQQGKVLTVTFDALKDKAAPAALVMKMSHGTLIPTTWDQPMLGVLGPPKLTPFAGKNVPTNTVATCQAINTANPTQNCVTWDSRR